MKKIFATVTIFLITVLVTVFFAFMLVEWLAGCGETYVDSKGIRHANQCVFLGQK